MANGNDLLQREIARLLNSRVDSMGGDVDPVTREISRLMISRGIDPSTEPEDGSGFLSRAINALTPSSREELGVIGAGILAPTLTAGQSLFQLPGMLTSKYLPTDKAADFLGRLSQGLTTQAETAALNAGASPELIADSHLLGEIVGFTIPVVASLKAARLALGVQGPVTTLSRNFMLDTTAGAIFGATLLPGENVQDRVVHSLRESALFGVGGLMLNGLVFAATGMRYSRARSISAGRELDETLRRVANGEQVVLNEAGIPLAQLLSEEGFLASSPEAYSMLGRFEVEEALLQSIKGAAEAGQSRGFIRAVGQDFDQVSRTIERFKAQFTGLKFDAIRGEVGYDVHFGTTGLNNAQRAQIKREGRYAGQTVEKSGVTYEYVRKAKGDRIVVRNADGKTTTIREDGITTQPFGVEEVVLPSAGQAMYADFKNFVFGRMSAAAGAEGGLTETAIINGLRNRTIDLSEQNLRLFEAAGAITHPTETGLTGPQIMERALSKTLGDFGASAEQLAAFTVEGTIKQGDQAYFVLRNTAHPQNPEGGLISIVRALDDELLAGLDAPDQIWVFVAGEQMPLEQALALAQRGGDALGRNVQEALQVVQEFQGVLQGQRQLGLGPLATPEGFTTAFVQGGKVAGDLLDAAPIRQMDDAFEVWLRERGLNPSAEDIEAFRANFNTRIRNDIWALVPEEDLAIMQGIREETLAFLDQNGMPFKALAHTKGFHVERLDEGRVALRDINTGARLEFGSENFARQALGQVVRSEKDPLFGYVTPGNHGVPALTGGFDPTDGIFTIDGSNVASAEFLLSLPFEGLTNRRDYFRRIEDISGVPIFSRGFAEIDQALLTMREKLEPISLRIAAAWKGLNRKQRIQVADFWTSVESSDLKGTALVRAARNAGLSNRQITAFTQSRTLFDYGAQLIGLPESRFIPVYYSRIRPRAEMGGRLNIRSLLKDDPIALREFEFWAEMPRTGDLPTLELDPEIVLHKYFRSLFYKQDISPLEQRVRSLVDMRIRDLSQTQQQAVMQRALPDTTKNSFVMPDQVRSVLTEYLNNVRGDGNPHFASMRRFTSRLFRLLGMETDGRLFDELHSTYLSMQYGAAIGLRPALANRNAVQNLWMMYTRVGGKHGTQSLRRAMNQSGYDEAVLAGAVRPVEVTVPMGDAIFDSWISDPAVVKGFNPLSQAFAAAIRKGLRLGQVSRKTAQKFLIPYGSSDQVNRAWAYHWQKMHTEEILGRFHNGKISWDQFLEDGLPFFSSSVKKEFRTQFDRYGQETALQWIGKQAADEAHFIYGSASTPTWMQTPFGRLFGVFGQWPLWAFEMYGRRMAHATPKQVGAFWARTIALGGAFGNMTAQSGINMWNWIAPASLEYAGGPFTDTLVQARSLVEGSVDQKAAALKNLGSSIGSLALPGQIFYQEISAALDQNDPGHAALMLTLGRPVDKGNFAYDFVYNPNLPPVEERPLSLEGLLRLDVP
jgi:hypothetical protein